jgi:hypothetical protein
MAEPSTEPALLIASAVAEYWQVRNRLAEAVEWIDQALTKLEADVHPELCVRLLTVKGMSLWSLGRGAEQDAVWAESEAIARGDRRPGGPLTSPPAARRVRGTLRPIRRCRSAR